MNKSNKSEAQMQRQYEEGSNKDIWSVFKIMGEFVEGFDTLYKVGLVYQSLDRQEQNQEKNTMNLLLKPGN